MKHFVGVLFVGILFTYSCTNDGDKKGETKTVIDTTAKAKVDSIIKPQPVYSTNNYFNACTSLISGVNDSASKYNSLLTTDTVWEKNAAFINTSWEKLDKDRLQKVAKWKDTEFSESMKKTTTVFYPFSGPDFLTAVTFFPQMDTIVMLGLEPVGKFPELDKMKAKDTQAYTDDLKASLNDIFNKSYFITKNMLQQLNNQKVNGTIPLISFFMKRTGNDITDVMYIIKKDSVITEVDYNYEGKEKPFGVKIEYVAGGKLRAVYYYRYNVANNTFNDTIAFYKRLNGMHNMITYMKSASYLLHNKFMSNIRDMIFANSSFILQDDTGAPFSFFTKNNDKWTTKIYGRYTKPVKDFPYLSEDSLIKKVFKDDPSIPDLPFHLGYHWGSKKDVLILAVRK